MARVWQIAQRSATESLRCEARDGVRCRAVKGTAQGAGSEGQRTTQAAWDTASRLGTSDGAHAAGERRRTAQHILNIL
eukprot:4154193-Pleurochrysis_carterae.AAC.4